MDIKEYYIGGFPPLTTQKEGKKKDMKGQRSYTWHRRISVILESVIAGCNCIQFDNPALKFT